MAKLDGYTLSERLRKARRMYPITATEQALYHELVAICNDVEWKDVFPCSNAQLCDALDINEKTLIRARNTLIQQSLVAYKSGKSRRAFGLYSFSKALTTVKNTVDMTADPTAIPPVDVTANKGANPTANAPDLIQTKTETEIKTKTEKDVGASAPPPKSFKKFSEEDFKEEIRAGNSELKLPPPMLHQFFRYWSEKSASGLMKFQLEKTWDTKRRLETWRDNQAKFDRNGNKHQGTTGKAGPATAGRSIEFDKA